jgi:acetate---CoA ligase (ADP-forming)
VALKTASPAVAHKSDVGGVRLDIRTEEELRAGYAELSLALGPEATVAAMAESGVELALGVVRDPQFGTLVMVAAGGALVELLRDRRFALPPVDEAGGRRMLDGLSVRPLLDGRRGGPALDVAAVAGVIARLSVLAESVGDDLDSLDVNPLVAGPAGCVAVDALMIPRSR